MGPTKQKYNPSLRTFALTLAFYSPKAYNFVRQTFNRSLPHLKTLSKWYQSVDGSPGFTKEALTALKLKEADSSKPLLCNLVFDEMSIRKQVEWTGRKFAGYVDIGSKIDSDTLPQAKQALVFMLVCINGSWKLPVGYFLLDTLAASEKAELVKKCLVFLNESGVVITSMTFDGAPTNISMAEELGANFSDPKNLKTSFKNPVTNKDIYIFLDACHMIKLVRNCFASQIGMKDPENRAIKWSYVSELVEYQDMEGLHAANKITYRHLQWEREKMRVRLATQTLSKSVSDAITFLREDLANPSFQGSEATSDFILNFNNLFDILNSKSMFAKYSFKRPISQKTAEVFFEFFEMMIIYINRLSINDVPVLKSNRKTGFLGLLICMESLKQLYSTYVVNHRMLNYILSYKISQDHLELFFSTIRSKGGFNNNPSARQFEAAYKRLLIHNEISPPNTGNVINMQDITILTCGSESKVARFPDRANLEEHNKYLSFLNDMKTEIDQCNFGSSSAWNLTPYVEDVVGYIAGFVIKCLKKFVSCKKCWMLMETDFSSSLLQERKTYGRLVKSSSIVIRICQAAEKYFRFFIKTNNLFSNMFKNITDILIRMTFETLPSSLFDCFGDHLYDDDPLNQHSTELVKLILKNYFKLRIHYETKKKSDLDKKGRSRSINTKIIHFRHE